MFITPTVFVLGAGASVDYGFPTGDQLLRVLSGHRPLAPRWVLQPQMLAEPDYDQKKRAYDKAEKAVRTFQRLVRDSALSPIDRIAERHAKHPSRRAGTTVGLWKKLVAQQILESESEQLESWTTSPDAESRRRSYLNPRETEPCNPWFRSLFSRIEDGTRDHSEIFSRNPIWIWTFNYDRLVEHLFFLALKANFQLPDSVALAALAKLSITHIHGDVGGFTPPQEIKKRPHPHTIPFGSRFHAAIAAAAERIRPAHEALPQSLLESLWKPLEPYRANLRMVFLGFGFDPKNLTKLGIPERLENGWKIKSFATWKGGHSNMSYRFMRVMNLAGINPSHQVYSDIRTLLDSIED